METHSHSSDTKQLNLPSPNSSPDHKDAHTNHDSRFSPFCDNSKYLYQSCPLTPPEENKEYQNGNLHNSSGPTITGWSFDDQIMNNSLAQLEANSLSRVSSVAPTNMQPIAPNLKDYSNYDQGQMTNSGVNFLRPQQCPLHPLQSLTNVFPQYASQSLPNQQIEQTNLEPAQASNIFHSVPGRLSMVNDTRKYDMTVSEVARRISPPESLSISMLSALFRQAKVKENTIELAEKVHQAGLNIPKYQRRQTDMTTFTLLTEGETKDLVNDLRSVVDNELNTELFAEKLNRDTSTESDEIANRREHMVEADRMMKQLQDLLKLDPDSLENRPELDELNNMSMTTHGFGGPAIGAFLGAFRNYLHQSVNVLDDRMHENSCTTENDQNKKQKINGNQEDGH